MNKSKRALRRHHQRRVFANRTKLSKWGWKAEPEKAHFLKHTATPCSCHMCRNPRRSKFYNSANRLTVAERRFLSAHDSE